MTISVRIRGDHGSAGGTAQLCLSGGMFQSLKLAETTKSIWSLTMSGTYPGGVGW